MLGEPSARLETDANSPSSTHRGADVFLGIRICLVKLIPHQ